MMDGRFDPGFAHLFATDTRRPTRVPHRPARLLDRAGPLFVAAALCRMAGFGGHR